MEVLVPLFTGLVLPVGLLIGGWLVGRFTERRHLERLAAEERALRPEVLVTQLDTPPADALDVRLVQGCAVMASDYFKQVAIGLRTLAGGEIRSYRPVLERARRQALVRALEEARVAGCDQVHNVRFETTMVGRLSVEVLCFGTAVRTRPLR